MSDNRTTELLCKLLEERGVEYETDADECCYDEQPSTTWDFNLCGLEMTVTAKEFVDIEGKTYLEMDFHHAFTPEQAIAATLGNSRAERTCKIESSYYYDDYDLYEFEFSCGHSVNMYDKEPTNYCPICGCKVVSE